MAVHSYIVRCYRGTPGDADCHDVPAFTDTLEQAVELAGDMLLAYRRDVRRTGVRMPLYAHLEDGAGHVVARVRATGPDEIERVLG